MNELAYRLAPWQMDKQKGVYFAVCHPPSGCQGVTVFHRTPNPTVGPEGFLPAVTKDLHPDTTRLAIAQAVGKALTDVNIILQ